MQTTEYIMETTHSSNIETDPDFLPIDGKDDGLPMIVKTLLKLGQILTQKEMVVSDVNLRKLSRLIDKHRTQLWGRYKGKEIRQLIPGSNNELRGGGVKVEWAEVDGPHYHSKTDLVFRFSRLLRPEDMKAKPKNTAIEVKPKIQD